MAVAGMACVARIRCPVCKRPFLDAAYRDLPSGNASLTRIQAVCMCGYTYRVSYRHVPVADDERRAKNVRYWREVIRTMRRSDPARAVAQAVIAADHVMTDRITNRVTVDQ